MCLALPGRIVAIFEEENLGLRRGKVYFADICKEVCLDYIPEARVGDYVLVHVGLALTLVDEQEANQVFEALRQLDEVEHGPVSTCTGSAESSGYNPQRVVDSSQSPV
ncbi:MAG TPA: HypC/HybG/HupF family hydrogenase formation chaperone [Terriglobales bacterium]|nr:HypC/HybG/HupF family hydrogenase formation chaperone [Dongiaceae bacterium]HVO64591.1 HypC/HybG/HupF family hydrogenase formation chaperone [Terriglobales bacterium]